MHGGDQNNAVLKATKDAIHHCCMAGISEIFDITDHKTQAFIKADIYAPHPEEVDPAVVTDYLEWWNVEAEVHQGGANPDGIALKINWLKSLYNKVRECSRIKKRSRLLIVFLPHRKCLAVLCPWAWGCIFFETGDR